MKSIKQRLAEEAQKKIKKKIRNALISIFSTLLPILLVVFIMFGSVLFILDICGKVVSSMNQAKGYMFGWVMEDTDSEEYKLKQALEKDPSDPDGISEQELTDMGITRADFIKILDECMDNNKDSKNTIKAEIMRERWCKQVTTVTNLDGEETELVKWFWQDMSGTGGEGEGYITTEYHSRDVEGQYRVNWTDVYAMYRIGTLSDEDASVDNGQWKEELNDKGEIVKLTSRISEERLQHIIKAFRFQLDYIYDPSRTSSGWLLEQGKTFRYSDGDFNKIVFTYDDSGSKGSQKNNAASTKIWPWNTCNEDLSVKDDWGDPPEEDAYLNVSRWRVLVPQALVGNIYNEEGIEYLGPNEFTRDESPRSSIGAKGSCAIGIYLNNWYPTGRTHTLNSNVFYQWAESISEAFTFDYIIDELEIMNSADTDRWREYKKMYGGYLDKSLSENGLIVTHETDYLKDENGNFKKLYIGKGNPHFDSETGLQKDSGKSNGDWNGLFPVLSDPSNNRDYFFKMVSAAHGYPIAIAIMANIENEGGSWENLMVHYGGRADPTPPTGHDDDAFGLCQWRDGRALALVTIAENMTAQYGKKKVGDEERDYKWYDVEVQTQRVIDELSPSGGIWNFNRAGHINKYKNLVYTLSNYPSGTDVNHRYTMDDLYHGATDVIAHYNDFDHIDLLTIGAWVGFEKPGYGDNSGTKRVNSAFALMETYPYEGE